MKDWRRRIMGKAYYRHRIIGTTGKSFSFTLQGTGYKAEAPKFSVLYNGAKIKSTTGVFRWQEPNGKVIFTSIDYMDIDTSECTNWYGMFSHCYFLKNVDLSLCDFSKATNISAMFEYCSSLQKVDFKDKDLSNVTNMAGIFFNCNILAGTIYLRNITKVTSLKKMFTCCSKLTAIDFTGCDFSLVTDTTDFLGFGWNGTYLSPSSLTKIIGGLPNLTVSVDMRYSPIEHDNAVEILQSLGTPTGDAQTITFKASTYSTLTDDEKKIATDKNWTVASA